MGVTDDILNRIYSVSTALLCTSMTEGFGLPLLEAMATRTVPIAPDAYSATELLTEGRGVLYPAATEIVSSTLDTMMKVVDPADVAAALETVYGWWRHDRATLYQVNDLGVQFAMSKSSDRCFERLNKHFAQLPEKRAADGSAIDPLLRIKAKRAIADCLRERNSTIAHWCGENEQPGRHAPSQSGSPRSP